ncbi:MAG TPA: hypothetical protein VE007_09290 [Thermoanaerobaculia bacterium]|nr:hypothetical protein [Thermoanaerobaculia bacterium]
MPSPYISPVPPALRDEPFLELEPDPEGRALDELDDLDAVRELEDLPREAAVFPRELEPLDFLLAVDDLREDDRDDFDDEDFFFDALFFAAPRDAEDLPPVFFARPELFDLPAAFPAAFFFFATGCSSSFRTSPEPGSYNSNPVESR